MKYDFGGYATKNDLKCTDGRIIRHDAFKECDGTRVPLVWQHMHDSPDNVLGHAVLENRDDGVYAYGVFNDTPAGQNAKELVKHSDIDSLSIYANKLKQQGSNVIHGVIRELSLCLSGANPGAHIDNLGFEHSDGEYETMDDEAIIYPGLELEHEDSSSSSEGDSSSSSSSEGGSSSSSSASEDGPTVADIFDEFTPEQKQVVYYMIGRAIQDTKGEGSSDEGESAAQSDDDEGEEGTTMIHSNVFDKAHGTDSDEGVTLSHSDIMAIMDDAQQCNSFREALHHASTTYGIQNIEILFPDAQAIRTQPDFIKREDAWVQGILNGTNHSPFSRIKSVTADITADEARAKGYIKGNAKTDEFFAVAKRETTPKTVYKKQKLDRDDIIDITSFDVVNYIRGEMRIMLDEEIARAIMFGDGRAADSVDKISETNIRPIVKDDALYCVKENIEAVKSDYAGIVKLIAKSRSDWKGTGSPSFYTSMSNHIAMLWIEDTMGRRIYQDDQALCGALGVSSIIEIDDAYFTALNATDYATSVGTLFGVLMNINDYTCGTDQGGSIASFDDFDIDYNQYKYLLETRLSGCLTRPYSALAFVAKPGA